MTMETLHQIAKQRSIDVPDERFYIARHQYIDTESGIEHLNYYVTREDNPKIYKYYLMACYLNGYRVNIE